MKRIFSPVVAFFAALLFGPACMRASTRDVAFTYRMGAGFPGDINRTSPFSALPGLVNTTTPPRAYGDPVLVNAADSSLRGVVSGDGSTTPAAIYGVLVRPFPTQQQTGGMSTALGGREPGPISGVADFLTQGFIMSKLPAGASVAKGGVVYVWCAATSGNNIQGGLVAAANSTNTLTVTNARFNGPADANGNVEIEVWPAR